MRRDAAKELFEQFDKNFVDTILLGREFEGTMLEVKQGPGEFLGNLRDTERGSFAKALSGFANTSGGVLVFGLCTSKREKLDIIDSVNKITNLKKFESAMRQAETRCVERLIQGIEYRSIEYDEDIGILAIYIPQSLFPPHRTKTDNHFYIRGGDSFVPLDLTLVEDLIHRRAKPELNLKIEQEHQQYESDFLVTLSNDGECTARDPFIVIEFLDNVKLTNFELDGNTYLASWARRSTYNGKSGFFTIFLHGTSTPVHPKTSIPLLRIRGEHASSGRLRNGKIWQYKFKYWIAAADLPLKEADCIVEVIDSSLKASVGSEPIDV